jgi:peptidoglycan/xylan/chitin deacetylase (PgdA/CDA1 family)
MRVQIAALLLTASAGLTLLSCTTNQTATLPPLPAVEAHVISSSAAVRRTVASTTDESLLDAEFQQVLNSDNPERAVREHVNRVSRIFYRSQGLLNDYDAKIESATKDESISGASLQTDDAYAKLLSAWMMRDEAIAKVRYFYFRSLQVETENSSDSIVGREMQTHAARLNNAVREALLSSANSTNRLAKQDLSEEILAVNEEFHASQASHNNQFPDILKRADAFTALLKNERIENPADMQKFYERNALQLARETVNARGDSELNGEIENLFPDVKRHLLEQFEDRAPQSAGSVAVGTGLRGMMSGTEFAKGVWALTFDDGPHGTYTMQDIGNLKDAGLKATFFWVAQNVSRLPAIVAKVKAAGMVLGNHSYTHAQLTKLGPSGLVHEIDDATAVDVAAYGFKPKFFRCPYGACGSQDSNVRQKIADQGMISIIWNVDSLDWQDKNPASVYDRVKKQMAVQKHGIILFHDIHPQSVAASKMIMADFVAGQKTGEYRVVTIEQAMNELNSAEGMK